jgi:hypothetical protein
MPVTFSSDLAGRIGGAASPLASLCLIRLKEVAARRQIASRSVRLTGTRGGRSREPTQVVFRGV